MPLESRVGILAQSAARLDDGARPMKSLAQADKPDRRAQSSNS
jgi:hypothetical protein